MPVYPGPPTTPYFNFSRAYAPRVRSRGVWPAAAQADPSVARGVMEEGRTPETVLGTPRSGAISPLLSNIYLHALDEAWVKRGPGQLVRYADNFLVLCQTQAEANTALEVAGTILTELGLGLHPDKARVVDLRDGRQGFAFLGCYVHARISGRFLERGIRGYYLQRWLSDRSMERIRQKVHACTNRSRQGVKDVGVLVPELNPLLPGWGNYSRTGNAAIKLGRVDDYVWRRLSRFVVRRYGRKLTPRQSIRWTSESQDQRLYRLRGTLRYPEAA